MPTYVFIDYTGLETSIRFRELPAGLMGVLICDGGQYSQLSVFGGRASVWVRGNMVSTSEVEAHLESAVGALDDILLGPGWRERAQRAQASAQLSQGVGGGFAGMLSEQSLATQTSQFTAEQLLGRGQLGQGQQGLGSAQNQLGTWQNWDAQGLSSQQPYFQGGLSQTFGLDRRQGMAGMTPAFQDRMHGELAHEVERLRERAAEVGVTLRDGVPLPAAHARWVIRDGQPVDTWTVGPRTNAYPTARPPSYDPSKANPAPPEPERKTCWCRVLDVDDS